MSGARLAVLMSIAACMPVYAQTTAPEKIQVANTQTLDFPAGGTLRMTNALGEITIQGWDLPSIEITTIKSSKAAAGPKDREATSRLLSRVKITAERKGDEVIVASEYPKHSKILRPFEGMTDFDLEYRIKVPRSARLAISEDMGETHIENVSGEIRAEDHMGLITVLLPDGQYAIDARSRLGSVSSDFPGVEQRRKFLGHAFLASPPAAGQKLFLRAGYGDIVIEKRH